MMNFPAVLAKDPMVLEKIACAIKRNKPVDGHAPGLLGEQARNYAMAGITSDHECTTEQEARDKINAGMKIIIREGSAARNFDALINLLREFPESIMFCTDDKHPDQLVNYHIDDHIKRALELGIDEFSVIRAATLNPVRHYKLDVGLLQVGDPADFIVVDSLEKFKVLLTYINGISQIEHVHEIAINNFNCKKINPEDIQIKINTNNPDLIRVIEVLDGQLITNEFFTQAKIKDGTIISDSQNDILKIVVVNRYLPAKPAVAFVKNFGFKHGAIASSVAHDSHNIIAVGVDDQDITDAINLIINEQGGISLVSKDEKKILPLPVAGLMSNTDGYQVAKKYEELDLLAKNLGSNLKAPFMSLSFMALLVIPKLKLSDLGLFDGERFEFTGLY
jgi:adenine deaminase